MKAGIAVSTEVMEGEGFGISSIYTPGVLCSAMVFVLRNPIKRQTKHRCQSLRSYHTHNINQIIICNYQIRNILIFVYICIQITRYKTWHIIINFYVLKHNGKMFSFYYPPYLKPVFYVLRKRWSSINYKTWFWISTKVQELLQINFMIIIPRLKRLISSLPKNYRW